MKKGIVAPEFSDSHLQRRVYTYRWDDFLVRIEKYTDGTLVDDVRIVRGGLLALQDRDSGDNVLREYLWGANLGGGIGGLLNLRQNGVDYSYLYDGKGNVGAVLDNTQAVVASYRYNAFGQLVNQAGTLDQPFRFPTKRYDEGTGLNYYGYRFYAPAIERWMNRDPLGEAGGINLYGFVQNDPVNAVDPCGLRFAEAWGAGGALIGGSVAAGGSLVVDVATGGLNTLATPAEITAGAAIGGAIGYGVGSALDHIFFAKKSGKEKASDIPSWAKGQRPQEGECEKDFADRLLKDKYGEGNYPKGPGSEHNKLKKFGDRNR